MVVILGLTLDGGRSILGRLCRLPPLVGLGQASMAIYLLHRSSVLSTHRSSVVYIVHPRPLWALVTAYTEDQANPTLFLAASLTILLSITFTKLVDEPLRNRLKVSSVKAV